MLFGKSVGILSNPLPKQSTVTPSEVSVQLQTVGHDDATPTSKITANVVVIRNCILRRQSTNTNCIYLIITDYYMGISILAWLSFRDPHIGPRRNMGRGMITRPIWKCPCIKLFITYFRHLEKRHLYWPETKSRPILAGTNMGLYMEMIL